MTDTDQFVRAHFKHFKAFESFSIYLRHLNILVGPNNSGKSTIITAFRILEAAMRRARYRLPTMGPSPDGQSYGHDIDLAGISIAEENIFYNYDDSEPASITFSLSNKNRLILYFPESGQCRLVPEAQDKLVRTTAEFRSSFNCPIGFVPILGPVEHNELLFKKEAAQRALYNYTASRNFRNIWYHFPDRFKEFRAILRQTWPGMDIESPRIEYSLEKPTLFMFCPEERIPREIFWAGFGFQVWCQMLTHLVQSSDVSLFLIDEPDIYLHSDLQRQLLGLLRNLGPDILIATHSMEMVTEAEPDDIVIVNKKKAKAQRIKHPSQLEEVFRALGSNLNPVLTQLAKTRRALFVEGKDFQIFGKFARKLGENAIGNRQDFAVVPIEGFSIDRIRSLKKGIETTLGARIRAAAILDRDFRSNKECKEIEETCKKFCDLIIVLECKEIENFLLLPDAVDVAARRRVEDRSKRTGLKLEYTESSIDWLSEYSTESKTYVQSQYLVNHRRFERSKRPEVDESVFGQEALQEFEDGWEDVQWRLKVIPGKAALSAINRKLQETYGVSITPTAVIDAMSKGQVPEGVRDLVNKLARFSNLEP